MNIVFRVDASITIGTGHLMRCLALAETLALNGAEVSFISRKHRGNLNSYILDKNFKLFELPVSQDEQSSDELNHYSSWLGVTWQKDAGDTTAVLKQINADYIIVDHYALDYRWERRVKEHCNDVVVVDDLANRRHECDFLIDQTLGRVHADYNQLVPETCSLLLGVQYALLRHEFVDWRTFSLSRRRDPALKNILIAVGGVDKNNMTAEIMDALNDLPLSMDMVIIIMGKNAPHMSSVCTLSTSMNYQTKVLSGVENMAELMAKSDLVIGAAGSSSWERCCLGVPSIALVIADNQKTIARQLIKNRMAMVLTSPLKQNMRKLFIDLTKDQLRDLSSYSSNFVDGHGCERVVKRLFEIR